VYLRIDPDHSAGRVDQRAAGGTRINGRVSLDDVIDCEAVRGGDLTLERGDDALAQRAIEAERVADRERGVTHAGRSGVPELERPEVQSARVDLQDRQVLLRLLADHLGRRGHPGLELH